MVLRGKSDESAGHTTILMVLLALVIQQSSTRWLGRQRIRKFRNPREVSAGSGFWANRPCVFADKII